MNRMVYPGDEVIIENNTIVKILERKNYISRQKNDLTRHNAKVNTPIIAANIDLALIVVSPKNPDLHPAFIDRYKIVLNAFNIPSLIVLNKSDLATEKTKEIIDFYRHRGEEVYETTFHNAQSILALKELIRGKRVILVGQSGVGKSTLTSHLTGNHDIRVGKIGEKTKRGRHTTTNSHLHIIDKDTYIIDTPGIRALSLKNIDEKEIMGYFKEFEGYKCRFKNCKHINEPTSVCGIKKALEEGKINQIRYNSYYKIMDEK